ncbi:MAG: isochorismate synthase [Micrococcales bacterium]|nr:isochorismate synthase [Micrococcales bacterium]
MAVSLRFHLRQVDSNPPLTASTAIGEPLVWWRRQEGLIGWGVAARADFYGPDRFTKAQAWWRQVLANSLADGETPDRQRGITLGPVCFGTFGFADDSDTPSTLVVPQNLIIQQDGQRWLLQASALRSDPAATATAQPSAWQPQGDQEPSSGDQAWKSFPGEGKAPASANWPLVTESPGPVAGANWPAVVDQGLAAIGRGEVEKVVLARQVVLSANRPLDIKSVIDNLARSYPDCWTFSVDGHVGATPELLVRSRGGLITSRVLAGTIRRTGDDTADLARAAALARSSKDLEEHDFAVASVIEALEPYVEALSWPDSPSVLHLPNVMHLATDVVGDLTGRHGLDAPWSVELAGVLHPTAAVCGTPAPAAAALIKRLEGADRGRYAGPVGWMGANGDGEWCIALRCGQFSAQRDQVKLWAGGGIVAGSIPLEELAETEAKLQPMRQALDSS